MKKYIEKAQNYIKDHKLRVGVMIALLILAVGTLYLGFLDENGQGISTDSNRLDFIIHALINIGPELAGIIIGVAIIDALNERRQDKQLKKQLILQMGSRHNDVADTAVRILRSHGWLTDGTLNGAILWDANLEGCNLRDAKLEDAILGGANLKGATLWNAKLARSKLQKAILIDADLFKANLVGAKLINAKLKGAIMWEADMEGVYLAGANLEEADMSGVNLTGAKNGTKDMFSQVKFLKGATMPDGRKHEEWVQDRMLNPDRINYAPM